MNPSVDNYLVDGCMRCKLGGTPECKVNDWQPELKALRRIVLECGLKEEVKWGVPCYTFQDSNIAMVSAFKEYCSLSFFKGVLLSDKDGFLEKQGENSQSARIIKFYNAQEILKNEAKIKALVFEAIELEKAGLKVEFKKNPEPIPEELQQKLDEDPVFKAAFEALTPGRQRGYIIHFSQSKQSNTRISRIEKCTPKILNGEGMHDKYKSMKK